MENIIDKVFFWVAVLALLALVFLILGEWAAELMFRRSCPVDPIKSFARRVCKAALLKANFFLFRRRVAKPFRVLRLFNF